MRNSDIINALDFFLQRLMELLKILFSILILPFSILAAHHMNAQDAYAYARYITHRRLNRLRTFSFTVKITVDHNIPQVHVQHYDDDVADANLRLNGTKFSSVRACIAAAFKEARRFSFVIFQTNDASGTFIQLRMDTGIFVIDFPLTPGTLNRDYAIDFIRYLRSKGFTKTGPNTFYRNKTYSIESVDPEFTLVDANVGKNMEEAMEFCAEVFTLIFGTTAIPEVTVG